MPIGNTNIHKQINVSEIIFIYYRVSGAWMSVMVLGNEINQKQHLREVETSIMTIGNTNIHKQINVS